MRVQSRQDFASMHPRPPFDRVLLIPIAIGVVSILGIGWILSTSDLRESFTPPTATPTTVPNDVRSLETEISSFFPSATPTAAPTGVPPLETETSFFFPSATPTRDETLPTATVTSSEATPETATALFLSPGTSVAENLPPLSAAPIPDQIQPLPAGKYDDTDPNIAYDQYWTLLKTLGTANAYKGTIHASVGIGAEASFRFTGRGFQLGYQRGMNFGTVTVIVDDQSYHFHEEAFDLVWQSPKLPRGDHFVRIVHESGETINLDSIEILP